jgi:endo-1,4-beta-xylanase
MQCTTLLWIALAVTAGTAQNTLPVPLGAPKPGPATDAPYAPQPILQGGVVVTLFPPGSPYLKADRIREPEQYNLSQAALSPRFMAGFYERQSKS